MIEEDGINEKGRLNERNAEDKWRRRRNGEREEKDKERKKMGVNERERKRMKSDKLD